LIRGGVINCEQSMILANSTFLFASVFSTFPTFFHPIFPPKNNPSNKIAPQKITRHGMHKPQRHSVNLLREHPKLKRSPRKVSVCPLPLFNRSIITFSPLLIVFSVISLLSTIIYIILIFY
jgi:hypothetical protein